MVFFATSMSSGWNLAIRHILPIFPFLILIAAFFAAVMLSPRSEYIWNYCRPSRSSGADGAWLADQFARQAELALRWDWFDDLLVC